MRLAAEQFPIQEDPRSVNEISSTKQKTQIKKKLYTNLEFPSIYPTLQSFAQGTGKTFSWIKDKAGQ